MHGRELLRGKDWGKHRVDPPCGRFASQPKTGDPWPTIGAIVGLDIDDDFQNGKRWWLRLHEKGSKVHEVPAHHKAEEYLDADLAAAALFSQPGNHRKGCGFPMAKWLALFDHITGMRLPWPIRWRYLGAVGRGWG